MSQTAGTGQLPSSQITNLNSQGMFDELQGMLGGLMGNNSVVGQVTPDWDLPRGFDALPEDVKTWFMRGDAGPSRLNEFLQKAPPEAIDKFRAAVNMGLIVPKNQAAQDIASAYGGLRAGDRTPLGTIINGMPAGMNPEYWAQYNNLVQNGINYQLGLIKETGLFDGMPTLQRQQIENQIAQNWVDRATAQFNSLETQRNNMAQNGLSQQQIDNQNMQKMSELFGGQMITDPATGQQTFKPTEQARQFDTTQTGWLDGQRTLAGQLQDWNMQKDVAQAASNPRDYIYAQMLGNARGGLAGMPATNQLSMGGMPNGLNGMGGPAQFQVPGQAMQPGQLPAQLGGEWNQMQTLATMQGQDGTGTAPGGQSGPNQPLPTAQQAGQDGAGQPLDLTDQAAWSKMMSGANDIWQQARQGMAGLPTDEAWRAMTPGGSTPQTFGNLDPNQVMQQVYANQRQPTGGAGQQYQFNPAAYNGGAPGQTPTSNAQQRLQALAGQGVPGLQRQQQMIQQGQQLAAQTGQQPVTTSAFSQALMKNRVVPQSGAMGTQGQWMTPGQIQSGFNPNKIRTQDYLRGKPSEQAGFQAVGSLAGYSEDDLTSTLKGGTPKFQTPGSARMI